MTQDSFTSRILRTFRRQPGPNQPGPNQVPQCAVAETGLATDAFRQILSAAKALLVYFGIDRRAGEQFHLNLGHGLSQRYNEEQRSNLEYQVLAQALRYHCHPTAAHQFFEAARTLDKDMPYSMLHGATFIDNGDARFIPTIDFYGLARDQARLGGMERESCPFVGLAGDLWDAGMDGLPEADPLVVGCREQLWTLVFGDQPGRVLNFTSG